MNHGLASRLRLPALRKASGLALVLPALLSLGAGCASHAPAAPTTIGVWLLPVAPRPSNDRDIFVMGLLLSGAGSPPENPTTWLSDAQLVATFRSRHEITSECARAGIPESNIHWLAADISADGHWNFTRRAPPPGRDSDSIAIPEGHEAESEPIGPKGIATLRNGWSAVVFPAFPGNRRLAIVSRWSHGRALSVYRDDLFTSIAFESNAVARWLDGAASRPCPGGVFRWNGSDWVRCDAFAWGALPR